MNYQAKLATIAILSLALIGADSSCEKTKVDLTTLPQKTIYFGTGETRAIEWLGSPISVEPDTGKVTRLQFPRGTPWLSLCPDYAEQLKNGLAPSAIAIFDSIRSAEKENQEFWTKVEANKGFCLDDATGRPKFDNQDCLKLFESPASLKQRMALMAKFLSNPTVEYYRSPRSDIALTLTALDMAAEPKVPTALKAGLSIKSTTINALVVSRLGTMSLAKPVKDCLADAAKTMNPKPTHIIDSVTTGALFTFSLGASDVKTSAKAGEPGAVSVNFEAALKTVKIKAGLVGELDGQFESNLEALYNPDASGSAEQKVREYFKNLAKNIKTPEVVSGTMTAL